MKNKIKKYLGLFKIEDGKLCLPYQPDKREYKKLSDTVFSLLDCLDRDFLIDTFYNLLESLLNYDIESVEDLERIENGAIDGEVNIYTSDLTSWLAKSDKHLDYVDQALEEYKPGDGFKLLSMAQWLAINDIWQAIKKLLSD